MKNRIPLPTPLSPFIGTWALKRSEPLGSLGEEGDPCDRPTLGFAAPIVSPPVNRIGPGPLFVKDQLEEGEEDEEEEQVEDEEVQKTISVRALV